MTDYVEKLSPFYCGGDPEGFREAVAEVEDAFSEFCELIEEPGASVRQAAVDTTPEGEAAADMMSEGEKVPSWLYGCAAVTVAKELGNDDVQEEASDILVSVCRHKNKLDLTPSHGFKP